MLRPEGGEPWGLSAPRITNGGLKRSSRKIGAECGACEENKMEESEVKERKRKPNFSPLQVSIITESKKKTY